MFQAAALLLVIVVSACGPKAKDPSAPGNSTPPPSSSTGSGSTPPEADCVCAMNYEPVCGADGKTYGNTCQADCVKVKVASQGACPTAH